MISRKPCNPKTIRKATFKKCCIDLKLNFDHYEAENNIVNISATSPMFFKLVIYNLT